ncbi:MAG: ARMT1-like domain-containing protein [Firmicutes bacterium]|nr:ARMT1-like domain-containing protein [Bacillota bacterium]
MEIQPECPSCVALQLMRTIQHRNLTNWRSVMADTLVATAGLWDSADNPGLIIGQMYHHVNRLTDCRDPYKEQRRLADQLAELYWQRHPVALEDLHHRLLYATAGNIIDAGLNANPEESFAQLDQAIAQNFAHDDSQQFFDEVPAQATLLYVTDNSGEAVFDREVSYSNQPNKYRIVLTVRANPFLNDMTRVEAAALGFSDLVDTIYDTGTTYAGFDLELLDPRARQAIDSLDGWILKGIANLEIQSHHPAPVPRLFLYRAKCPPTARLAAVPWNSNVAWLE